MTDYPASKLTLTFQGQSDSIVNWEQYSFASNFLTPCDAFTLTVGDETISPQLRSLLMGGSQVQLRIDTGTGAPARPLATGYIDQVETDTSRAGTFITIRGRDLLGNVCDAQIDPWSPDYKFSDGDSMGSVLGRVFDDFGITSFWTTDAVNRSAITGVNFTTAKLTSQTISIPVPVPGTLLSEDPQYTTEQQTIQVWNDPTKPTDLTALKTKKLEPLQDETCFEFCEKLAKRFHLHIWAMASGQGVIVGGPDYTQDPLYSFTNRLDGQGNNVIRGTLSIDYVNQPSAIIAKGVQGGGDVSSTRMHGAVINEFIGYPASPNQTTPFTSITTAIGRFKGLVLQPSRQNLITSYSPYFTPPNVPRIVYLEDKHSKTIDQLIGNITRKLSEHQRNAFRLHYTVQDHAQNGTPYTHNTIATVNDEELDVQGNFWIESVTYKKSRQAGTLTDLVMIPVGTLLL